jgi:hypothetical protein
MIVKCISTSSSLVRLDSLHFRWLTLDKIYNVIEYNSGLTHYDIRDDDGKIESYPQHCFMDLMLWRNQQIESLLQ